MPWENRLMKNQNFHGAIPANDKAFSGFDHMKCCLSGEACFNYFVLQNTAKMLCFICEEQVLKKF